MIYYFCPDNNEPFGGIKKIYDHVDILNENGMPAAVLHQKRGFRCTWFQNDTRIVYLRKADITAEDFMSIPEFYNLAYLNPKRSDQTSRAFRTAFDTHAKKVIYNQGTYLTFNGNSFEKDDLRNLHTDSGTVAIMTVSEDGEQFLRHAFTGMNIYRVHNSIHAEVFSFSDRKKKQICFMPRRNRDHSLAVINILKFRKALDGFTVVPIEGKTERQTAQIMKDSLIFLSFGYPEGFSLPPAEAMSCGCIVIGYHGLGGREYFHEDLCYPIETGDILGFARKVEEVIRTHREHPDILEELARKGSLYIRNQYSRQREQEDVLRCWTALLSGTQERPATIPPAHSPFSRQP